MAALQAQDPVTFRWLHYKRKTPWRLDGCTTSARSRDVRMVALQAQDPVTFGWLQYRRKLPWRLDGYTTSASSHDVWMVTLQAQDPVTFGWLHYKRKTRWRVYAPSLLEDLAEHRGSASHPCPDVASGFGTDHRVLTSSQPWRLYQGELVAQGERHPRRWEKKETIPNTKHSPPEWLLQ